MKKNDLPRKASAKWGFTLIEILVVVTIIGLLAGAGAVSYSQFIKQARDARRKADLELIRSAIEQYRADNDEYPDTYFQGGNFNFGHEFPLGCDGSSLKPCYMSKVPQDIKTGNYYWYDADPVLDTYKLGAFLESSTAAACILLPNCNTAAGCNYCLGPYGEQ